MSVSAGPTPLLDPPPTGPASPSGHLPLVGFVPPPVQWRDDLRRSVRHDWAWLWQGYLRPGGVTLLTSLWKSGKTTLVSLLLARMRAGGQLLGLPVAPARAVVLSEEGADVWDERSERLGLDSHVCWQCQPFLAAPRPPHWHALLDQVVDLRHRHGVTLAVIDSLTAFLPSHAESNAASMMEALTPLRRLTSLDMSILLIHHPRKKESMLGMAARGSGALPAFVDILLEMNGHRNQPGDRRRWLHACSRHNATPRQLAFELNPGGSDYLVLGDAQAEEFSQSWHRLHMVLEDARRKLTRQEILAEWPPDFDAPDKTTLWKWLDRAVAQELVCQEGSGRKNHPFRYWLPGQEARWEADALALLEDLGGLQPIPGTWPVPTRAKETEGQEKQHKARKQGKGFT